MKHAYNKNDCLLFCRATGEECRNIIDILETYKGELGQKVNKNKTVIFFSKSTDEATKQEIKAALGLQEIVHFVQYLGLPSLVGRRKKEGFNFIKEKIWKESSYLKPDVRSSLKQSFKPYQHMLWDVSNSL